MPELTPTGAVDVVQRQVRRVRRRKNLFELQRASYLTIAAAAAAATALLPVALLAPTDVFTIAVWSMVAILAGLGLVIAGSARRRWLRRAHTLGWIEGQGDLGGRVRTLVELAERPGTSQGFFHGLLVEQIARGLDGWTPRRLVPRAVPRGALAGALVMAALLLAVLRLASLALPAAPTIAFADGPPSRGERGEIERRDAAPGERIVVAPGVPDDREGPTAAEADERDDESAMTQLSSALQETVRRQVWGKAWERVRDALARAATPRDSESGAPTDESDADADAEASDDWEVARAPSGELVRRRRPGIGKQPSGPADDAARDEERRAAESASTPEQEAEEGGDGGAGAGNGTEPDLFGGEHVERGDGDESFELSLAARMRTDGGGSRAANGPPPEAAPDARPALAGEQRRESAAHRMTVPASYETVVREVFAHREPQAAGASARAMTPALATAAIADFQQTFAAIRAEMARVVIGHETAIETILTAFFAGGHVLIEGVPGIGKTLIVRSLAEALNLSFNRIQFTVDLMPADVTGTRIIQESHDGRRELVFMPGPIFAHVLLGDEINRATPKTQSALLEAMAEQQVTAAGTSYRIASPFFVLATLNPIEMEGTYQLPEAQLDRFLFKVLLEYPSEAELVRILATTTVADPPTVRPVLEPEGAGARVEHLKRLVREVLVAPHVEQYVAGLVRLTTPAGARGDGEAETEVRRYVTYGASPRGAQAMVLGAKVRALLASRPHVTYDDVDAVAVSALRHRLVMSFAAEAAGVAPAHIIERVLVAARRLRS